MKREHSEVCDYEFLIIIAGSRKYTNRDRLYRIMKKLCAKYKGRKMAFVSGLAPGPDMMAVEYCKEFGGDWFEYPADWDNVTVKGAVTRIHPRTGKLYNVMAGHMRNNDMADVATHLVAFWDGKSTGTKDMIKRAKDRYLPVWPVMF
jgi:hypothetical protein